MVSFLMGWPLMVQSLAHTLDRAKPGIEYGNQLIKTKTMFTLSLLVTLDTGIGPLSDGSHFLAPLIVRQLKYVPSPPLTSSFLP